MCSSTVCCLSLEWPHFSFLLYNFSDSHHKSFTTISLIAYSYIPQLLLGTRNTAINMMGKVAALIGRDYTQIFVNIL